MKINDRLYHFVLVALGAIFFFLSGRLSVQVEISSKVPPIHVVNDVNPKVPLVEITDVKNGKILGTVNRPEIRLSSGPSVAVPDEKKHFELSIEHLGFIGSKQPKDKALVPTWAKFVASKKGKYFYDLSGKSAKNLSPENKVFFATEQEAKEAGYAKRSK